MDFKEIFIIQMRKWSCQNQWNKCDLFFYRPFNESGPYIFQNRLPCFKVLESHFFPHEAFKVMEALAEYLRVKMRAFRKTGRALKMKSIQSYLNSKKLRFSIW